VSSENNLIDWDNVKIMDHKSDRTGRVIKEAMWIRKTNRMNRDGGNYQRVTALLVKFECTKLPPNFH